MATNTNSTTGSSILIVDDVPANLQLLVEMLRERGYKPRPVTSGPLALQAALQSPPDLILLDINMPGMDGFEVCRRIKSDPRLSEIPVLFISALNATWDKVKAFSAGAVDYVTKPFQCEEVEARIQMHLELRRRARLLEESLQKLRKVEALRDNLTQMIVHDMRGPIFAVQGAVSLLSRSAAAQEAPAQKVLQAGRESLAMLSEMTTQLLDISRLEEGIMPIRKSHGDLVVTATKACRVYEHSATEKKMVVEAPVPVLAEYDEDLIRRVVGNLVGNALKFSPRGTEITVEVGRVCPDTAAPPRQAPHPGPLDGGAGAIPAPCPCAIVSVTDQGPGIAPEYQEKIFEKYGQADEGRQKYGIGLGLAFCRLAVTAHGGDLGVESAPGKGSTFWFTLPLAETAREPRGEGAGT